MAITFEIEYLRSLKEDSRSCVYVEHSLEHLALHPFQLDNISKSIKELLNKNIAKYCSHLNGILLGYDNIKLLASDGLICGDSCFVHTDIEADFYVFKPEIDSTLQGVINKISKDHVACLVHKTFTISLPKPEDAISWIGNKAQIGQEVQFTIVEAVFEGSLPYIRGNINSLDNIDDSGFSTNEDQLGNEEYQFETPKEKKSIRKRKLTESMDDQVEEEEEIISVKHKKKKKDKIVSPEDAQEKPFKKDKKKKKIFEDDLLRVDFSTILKDDSFENAANCIEKTKSKKRKRNTMEFEPPITSDDISKETKTKKRKRNSLMSTEKEEIDNVEKLALSKIKKSAYDKQHKKKQKSKAYKSVKLINDEDSSDDAINVEKCTDNYEHLLKRLSLDIGDNSLIGELNNLLSEKQSKIKTNKGRKHKKERENLEANESIELDLNTLFKTSPGAKCNEKLSPVKILSDISITPDL